MLDITSHISSYREAKSLAIVKVSKKETIEAIVNKTVAKGDVFEISKTAGLLAIKKTSDVIPDCHPVPVENVDINHTITGNEIHVEVAVSTVYKTGIEIEALYGASVVALTIYDLLKPIDKSIEITSIKVLEKEGGKSAFQETARPGLNSAVIICSNAVYDGKKDNKAGIIIKEKLQVHSLEVSAHEVIPNDAKLLKEKILDLYQKVNIMIIAGGTGLLEKDNTPEIVSPLLDKLVPGIAEAARSYGQARTPLAMLSRGIAGLKGKTLILVVPGSSRGAKETMDALFPYVLHTFKFQKL